MTRLLQIVVETTFYHIPDDANLILLILRESDLAPQGAVRNPWALPYFSGWIYLQSPRLSLFHHSVNQ